MTCHLDSHMTTDVKPDMLSGVQPRNGIPHDIIYAALPMRAQTEKTTFSCNDATRHQWLCAHIRTNSHSYKNHFPFCVQKRAHFAAHCAMRFFFYYDASLRYCHLYQGCGSSSDTYYLFKIQLPLFFCLNTLCDKNVFAF